MKEARDVVDRCERLLNDLQLPDPFDMETLCNQLGQAWDSNVCLMPVETSPDGPCGMWISLELKGQQWDVFAYELNSQPWHQAQMVFHEIGHRICGHSGETELPLTTAEVIGKLAPNLSPGLVQRILGCAREPSAYADQREAEAEYIGARLLDQAYGWRASPLSADAPIGLQRLQLALGAATPGRST